MGTFFGISGRHWVSGLLIGGVIGMMMFDNWIVGVMFGVSIGTAFAMAFHSGGAARERGRDDEGTGTPG